MAQRKWSAVYWPKHLSKYHQRWWFYPNPDSGAFNSNTNVCSLNTNADSGAINTHTYCGTGYANPNSGAFYTNTDHAS